jgi:hypothetical protein
VPSSRAAVTARQWNARAQLFTLRLRAHCRLARRPLTVAFATIRPPTRACEKVAVAE